MVSRMKSFLNFRLYDRFLIKDRLVVNVEEYYLNTYIY